MQDFAHISVLYHEVLEQLDIKADGTYLDGTTGGGGHSSGILKALGPDGRLICLDRDLDAIEAAREVLTAVNSPASFVQRRQTFSTFDLTLEELGILKIDGFLLDLGVSSWQLDEGERGFSYMHDGPLDMRMDQSQGVSAFEIVNTYTLEDLSVILDRYGEEKEHFKIARGIVRHREEHGAIETTQALADVIIKNMSAKSRRQKGHPAKRSFQALRIYVNDELGELERFLDKCIDFLKIGGKLAIISFHSLEDRMVKQRFREWENPCTCPVGLPCACGKKSLGKETPRGGIVASDEENTDNRRAHSARLRVFTRCEDGRE